jgi:hypothetical protein
MQGIDEQIKSKGKLGMGDSRQNRKDKSEIERKGRVGNI